MAPPASVCPACGAPAAGNFCSTCGASLTARSCRRCRAELLPRARFCHRCGRPVTPPPRPGERAAWIFAAAVCLLVLGGIAYRMTADPPAPTPPPVMANPGAENEAGGLPAGPAPDISRMSPRERFDRLFNRVMQASERGDTAEAARFVPMALGAYAQLDTVNADARYHAAVLRLQTGDTRAALALADTILAQSPGHLFGYVVRGEAARIAGDSAALARARRDFAARYDAELRANRVEYLEHRPVLEEFNREAGPREAGRR